jgi:hypothetical protein
VHGLKGRFFAPSFLSIYKHSRVRGIWYQIWPPPQQHVDIIEILESAHLVLVRDGNLICYTGRQQTHF